MIARIYALLGVILVLLGAASPALGRGGGPPTAPDVTYVFELEPGPPVSVRVRLWVKGEADGTSRLAATESWGGVRDCERFVHNLAVLDGSGRPCAVKTDPADPHGWTIEHEPGVALLAHYELRAAPKEPLSAFGTHYEPVIRDDLVHVIGQTGLITPAWLTGPVDIAVEWRGFEEQGWRVTGSFAAEGWRTKRPLDEFRHAMFLAGKVRLHDREIPGGRLQVAVYGDGWGFKDEEMADLAQQVVAAERRFVGDTSDPFFLVTVVPAGAPAGQGFSMGGTGLTNCFALFMAPGATIGGSGDGPQNNRDQVLHLLAHEYFHTWIGGKIKPDGPEELQYWFSEGFTDFFANRVLRQSGLAGDARWLARTNATLKNLWTSPVREEPAEAIRSGFWTSPDLQKLPYLRGEVVALALDEEIRRASGGRSSIDDFLRELLADAAKGEKADTERLLARIGRWTSADFAATLRRVVVDGGLPDPPARLTEPAAGRFEAEAYSFDPGFDIDATVKTRKATGVRERGPAHAAGMREGQAIAGLSIVGGDPDRQVMVKVREGEEVRTLEFWPRGPGRKVPAYRLIAAPGPR